MHALQQGTSDINRPAKDICMSLSARFSRCSFDYVEEEQCTLERRRHHRLKEPSIQILWHVQLANLTNCLRMGVECRMVPCPANVLHRQENHQKPNSPRLETETKRVARVCSRSSASLVIVPTIHAPPHSANVLTVHCRLLLLRVFAASHARQLLLLSNYVRLKASVDACVRSIKQRSRPFLCGCV